MNVTASPARYATVRAAAADAVRRVTTAARYLETALIAARAHYRLHTEDAAMAQELGYGVLRWYLQLDAISTRLLQRPLNARDADLHALLLTGLYQLRHQRVDPGLAVDTTVEAATVLGKPWAKGMLNACLRRAQREAAAIDAWVAEDPIRRYSHPGWLIERLRAAYPDRWASMLDANNARPPLTLRINERRTTVQAYADRLRGEATGLRGSMIECVPSALVVEPAVSVERLPGFRDGVVSVQDAAAQLAAYLLDTPPGARVLDACAAPGGKTGHVLEHSPGIGELVAIDADERRLQPLRENLARLQLAATVIAADTAAPAGWWDGKPFDRILLDVPCSASGVIRRHPDIKLRRRAGDLPRLAQSQMRLLEALWPLLSAGGKLLYCTCSVLPEENDTQIRAFLGRHQDSRCERLDPGVGRCSDVGLQILPGEQGMDGFYHARIAKH